ncbi:head-tail connector protein [Terasakiella sp.]|uniref:head-tail connector protein n=1 Tax=Terasakiella sp. TaxID=2034861 RepID=UPI003AA9A630
MDSQLIKGARTNGGEIITLEQAKFNSKIDYDYEDELLQMYVDAIPDEFENYTGNVILEREMNLYLTRWEPKFSLGVSPVQSITSVKYYDENGDQQTVAPEDYKLFQYDNGTGPRMLFKFEVEPTLVDREIEEYPIEIKFKAGYANANIPADIKKAALLSFSNVETFREDMPIKYNRTIYSLLGPYKRY